MARHLGFRFNENMVGSYHLLREPEAARRFAFHYDVVSPGLWRTLRDGRAEAAGTVEAEGLAERAELAGFIVIRPLVARTIRYEFHFSGDDGSRYRFAGEKTIRHLHPIRTWTTLPGALYDAEDRAIAHSLSHFDLKELGPFLRSFKLARV
jgi:hypothetical protein